MGKRNKIRYQAEKKPRIPLVLSGNVFLRYADEDAIEAAGKGDLQLFPNNDALNSTRLGEYESTGFSGYFKLDVYDGRNWQPVILTELFPGRENHFTKTERPLDTYHLCADMLSQHAGKALLRTYREHYIMGDEESNATPA